MRNIIIVRWLVVVDEQALASHGASEQGDTALNLQPMEIIIPLIIVAVGIIIFIIAQKEVSKITKLQKWLMSVTAEKSDLSNLTVSMKHYLPM